MERSFSGYTTTDEKRGDYAPEDRFFDNKKGALRPSVGIEYRGKQCQSVVARKSPVA